MKYQVFIIGFIIVFNICWLLIDPLVWKRIAIVVSDSGEVAESTGICVMQQDVYYAIGPMLLIMILLLMDWKLLFIQRKICSIRIC